VASLNIPLGTRFQFRNTGAEPLCFIIATLPPWPGEDEAITQVGHWEVPADEACQATWEWNSQAKPPSTLKRT
jgi:hypothetical protein